MTSPTRARMTCSSSTLIQSRTRSFARCASIIDRPSTRSGFPAQVARDGVLLETDRARTPASSLPTQDGELGQRLVATPIDRVEEMNLDFGGQLHLLHGFADEVWTAV